MVVTLLRFLKKNGTDSDTLDDRNGNEISELEKDTIRGKDLCHCQLMTIV